MGINVLAVDDHDVVLAGLGTLFGGTEISLGSTAKSSAEALEKLRHKRPDVVLMDIRMPGVDGLSTLARIKTDHPDLPVVMYTAYDNQTYLARALALGAAGYVRKSDAGEKLVDSIRKAATGGLAWTPQELQDTKGPLPLPNVVNGLEIALTQRESEVLHQMANGLTNKEIAKMLKISYETVKEHVQHILRKIGVKDRTQAAVWAVRNELV
jgi:DNA-binding NarL/FixJ family response regulator